jgi:radical SAM protein with 4Fe4S-binding SPASM domain
VFRRLRERGRRIAPAGLHHWTRDGHRFHLRVEEDGKGMLTVDASRIVHLNPVACDSAWMILSGVPDERMTERITSRYRVDGATAAADLQSFREAFDGILSSGAGEPISYVNLDVTEFFRTEVSAPYRMDLALTYRCNVSCSHCYNRPDGPEEELDTAAWKGIIGRIRDIGIPHVIFTGGEATLREDLPELIGHAESLGLVTGLLTNGVRLAGPGYADLLAGCGLDHVQVTLESPDPAVHEGMTGAGCFGKTVKGIGNCIEAGIFTLTNTTLTRANAGSVAGLPEFVKGLGLAKFAVNAVIHGGKALEGDFALDPVELEDVLTGLTGEADRLGMEIVWYSPTRYCTFDPMELDLGPKRCTAGEYNLCVEPDGGVLPCQSWYEPVGSMLTDDWDSIWNHPAMVAVREREWVGPECRECTLLSLCGGGCPLEKRAGAACRDST